jgi:AcrR family transcriptional regulator
MNQSNTPREVFSREKWLDMAIGVMAKACKNKFSLDSLLSAMPVTKGSFYSHFKNRTDFLIALVDYWDRKDTELVIHALISLSGNMSPQDQLWELMCVIYEKRVAEFELLIRSLAMESPEIRAKVRDVDKKRLTTVGKLFAQMGFEGDELKMRTHAFVTTSCLDGLIYSRISDKDYRQQLRLRHEFFTRR